MIIQTDSVRGADADAKLALRLTRSITVTWWYTVYGALSLALILVVVWATALIGARYSAASVTAVSVGGVVWLLAMVPLLLDYRGQTDSSPAVRWRRALLPLAVGVAYGMVAGLSSGIWIFAVFPLIEMLMLLNWPPGVRWRVVLAGTVVIGALWVIDAQVNFPPADRVSWVLVGFYSASLPTLTVLSLWWWDVLVALDRARASEARLAATQERLRVATDVHDLQGHHLQVIALQLELAERLMGQDAAAALVHLQEARVSVDGARQGTRDLATRFRSVPLGDEIANAVDLLRAAGTAAEASVDPDAGRAPASVYGPVIRETTTNALRHGGGTWARLSLTKEGTSWRFEIANDAEPDQPGHGESGDTTGSGDTAGSGLAGIGRRAAEAGGTLDVQRGKQTFTVVVTVPSHSENAG